MSAVLPASSSNRPGRDSSLDGARGLAVLIVFLSHSSGREMAAASWLQFQGIGHVGVYLFFVLSGFLLTRTLMEGVSARQFYIRRFFRIVPLYFLVLAGVLLYQISGHYSSPYLHISGGAPGALLHFVFLKGDTVFWTLAAEFTFYLLLPAIVVAVGRHGWRWLAWAAAGYFLWFYAIQVFHVPLPALKFVDIAHKSQFLDVFICGILAAYVQRPLPKLPVAAMFWGLILLTLLCVSANAFGARMPWYGLRWLSLLYGIVFALGLVAATQGNRWVSAPLEMRWLKFMGVVGFSWYLLHFPTFQIVNAYGPKSPAIRLLLSTIGCALVSWITYRLIERPGIRLGRRVEAYRLIKRPARVV